MQAEIKTRLTQSMGESKKPIITYKDDTNIWQHISKELTSRFPLNDIECRGIGNQKMNRIINSLDIEWRPFSEEWQNKNVYTQLQQAPFLNLYILNCSDLEQYKNTIKDKIKYWLNIIESKKNQEWMIICISGESNTKSILGIRTSIYDKIKSDFNLNKDRLILVKLYSEVKESDIWGLVVGKIKEKLLSCFFQQVLTLQENIKRLDSQRLLPGWNYCSFFILKEQLALLYDTFNLYQDALVQYDELEASFYQTLVEQGAAWFKSFGGTEEGDDSLDFLNLKRKPFREMIIQNTTTIFDFRMYLFARQCQLLFRLDKPAELCQRAKLFISSFSMTLTDYKGALFPFFKESWIYSTCMNIVSRCEELASISWHNNQTLMEFEGASGELLHLARSQLDILGRACNYLPDNLDKPTYDPDKDTNYETEIFDKITNQHLKNLLNNVESFDEIYNLITSRAIHCFEGCKRQRSIWLLKSDIAKLHFYRGRLKEASESLLPLCNLYAKENWHGIESNLLQMLAICQKHLNQNIPYLETCITILANRSFIDDETFDKYTDEMVETIDKMEEGYEKEISSVFKYELKSLVHQLRNDSGILFEVYITNPFKKTIKINNLNLELISKENNKLIFDCNEINLEPGKNTIQLKCEHPISGKYNAKSIEFSINKFKLKSDVHERAKKIYTVKETSSTLLIKAGCVQPVEYEKPSDKLLLSIYSKSNSISSGTLSVSSITGISLKYPKEIVYKIMKEESDEPERIITLPYDNKKDYISLPECDENEIITFEVPFVSEKLNISIHRMTFTFDYIMKNGVHRFHSLFEKVKISTPFIYNNNVTYSHDCTILQINFFSKDQIPIHIRNIELIAPGYEVEDFLIEKKQIIFQNQDVSLVYCLRNSENGESDVLPDGLKKDELSLHIDYYYLNEEIEAYIEENVSKKLKELNLSEYSGFLNKFLNSSYELVDSVKYGMYGKIRIDSLSENYQNVESIIETEESSVKEQINQIVDEICKSEISTSENENDRIPLKTMIYKVKVPKAEILLEADLEMNQDNPIIGMICKGKLKIKQVKWESNVEELKFYYDIAIRFDNWMVSGHKKRVFNLKPNEEKDFTFDFIPLKTGMLLIPTVEVNCLTEESPTIRVIHTSDAKQISVIPKIQSSTIYVNNSVFDPPDKNRGSL